MMILAMSNQLISIQRCMVYSIPYIKNNSLPTVLMSSILFQVASQKASRRRQNGAAAAGLQSGGGGRQPPAAGLPVTVPSGADDGSAPSGAHSRPRVGLQVHEYPTGFASGHNAAPARKFAIDHVHAVPWLEV